MRRRIWALGSCLLAFVAAFCPAGQTEAGYRFEIQPEVVRRRSGDDVEEMYYLVQAVGYLAPVKADEGPFGEAAFLERAGSFALLGGWNRLELDGPVGDGPVLGAGFTYSRAGFPLWASVQYNRDEASFRGAVDADITTQDASVDVGFWVWNGLRLGAGYERWEQTAEVSGQPDFETTHDVFSGTGKLVKLLGREQAFSLTASYSLDDFDSDGETGTNSTLFLAADYYFARDFGLGVTMASESGDDKASTGRSLGVRAEGFAHPMFALYASARRFFADADQGSDAWTFVFGLLSRL